MNGPVKRLLIPALLFPLSMIGAPQLLAQEPRWPVPSVWEAIEISPVTMMDSNPRGFSNLREFYTSDGQLCVLRPDETLTEATECAELTFSGNRRIVHVPDGDSYPAEILQIGTGRSKLRFSDQSVVEYRRLELESVELAIRPQSLHVLRSSAGSQLRAQDVEYLDPPEISEARSLIGVWEAIEFRGIPRPDLPPYGFPNLKWIVSEKQIAQIMPAATSPAPDELRDYQRSGIFLTLSGQRSPMTISFDEWGDLILSSADGVFRLRQLTDDPADIPVIPTKVALLAPGGDP